jgi:hypothetical protein
MPTQASDQSSKAGEAVRAQQQKLQELSASVAASVKDLQGSLEALQADVAQKDTDAVRGVGIRACMPPRQ